MQPSHISESSPLMIHLARNTHQIFFLLLPNDWIGFVTFLYMIYNSYILYSICDIWNAVRITIISHIQNAYVIYSFVCMCVFFNSAWRVEKKKKYYVARIKHVNELYMFLELCLSIYKRIIYWSYLDLYTYISEIYRRKQNGALVFIIPLSLSLSLTFNSYFKSLYMFKL